MTGQTVNLRLAPEHIAVGQDGLLLHQQETVEALKHHPIVMNCAMTGAGKTRASHLGVLHHAHDKPVLLVAPTNALVSQHFEDAKQFVNENRLPHKVVAVDGSTLSRLMRKRSSIYRTSAVLHQLIYNPREFAKELGIDDIAGPLWLITNPDQIWLSIVKGRDIDTRNLLTDFINSFRFVIVDEFHYYTAEQLVLFFLCVGFWQHFGQFDDDLKMLLLTATPDRLVEDFFTRLGFAPCIVGNNNQGGKTTPVLAPIELTLTVGPIEQYTDFVLARYDEGKDGVIISDSLFEINKAYQVYQKCGISVGRITGPINNETRKTESRKRLILATPTVDLGFNFIKPYKKERQEIDFLVSTVRNKSAFWQRLGRAGRVLGRSETQTPSQAILLLPDTVCHGRVGEFEGMEISRKQLEKLLDLEGKRLKGHALTREGLFTITKQLAQIEDKMLPENRKHVAEKIFDTLKSCLDPDNLTADWQSFKKRHWLAGQLKRIDDDYRNLTPRHIFRWLKDHDAMGKKEKFPEPMETLLGAWAKNHFYREGKLDIYNRYVESGDRMTVIQPLAGKKQAKREIAHYFREQKLRLDYLFNFRGSGVNQEFWVFDPIHLHSPHLISKIDLTTILSKYKYQGPFTHSVAEAGWKTKLPKNGLFFEITEFQDYPFRPVFESHEDMPVRPSSPESHDDGELLPRYWQTVALHDLSLEFKNNKTGFLSVPMEIKPYLTGLSELFFVTPMENRYVLENWLKEYDVRTGTLLTAERPYGVVFGRDAIWISEELYYRKRKTC